MKKLIALIAVLCIAIFASGLVYALEDTVAVDLMVSGVFTFAIGEDTLSMGTVAEGAAGGGGVTLWCASNLGVPWVVDVKATDVTGDSTGGIIPMSNLLYTTYALPDGGGTDSAGTFVPTNTALLITNQQAYAPSLAEQVDTDVRVGLYITLNVPWNTQQDTYRSTITCTMYPL